MSSFTRERGYSSSSGLSPPAVPTLDEPEPDPVPVTPVAGPGSVPLSPSPSSSGSVDFPLGVSRSVVSGSVVSGSAVSGSVDAGTSTVEEAVPDAEPGGVAGDDGAEVSAVVDGTVGVRRTEVVVEVPAAAVGGHGGGAR
ncbi:MAG: hypothetical protein SW127_10010, partial [Actinomycetota bacterium]|nr:hypothetical protein [Actinomycetota bacterium]